MSLKDARKFVVDFDSDPKLRLRIAEIKVKKDRENLTNYDKLKIMQTVARERGYNFTMDELKEANNCAFGEMDDFDLTNVAGGLASNKYALSRAFPVSSIGDLFDVEINVD